LRSDAVLLVFADVGIGSPVRFSSTSAFHIICKCQMCAITHPTLGFMKALFTSLEHCGVLPQEAVELLSCGPIEMFTAVELFTASEASGCGALPRGADKYSRRWHGTHGHLEFERSLSPIHALEACMHGCTETLFDQTLPQTRNKCSKSRSRHGPQWAPVSRQQDVCQGPSHIARTRACTKHERLCCLNIFNI
jgi:hypothetical protein